jgi:hypothetical protein
VSLEYVSVECARCGTKSGVVAVSMDENDLRTYSEVEEDEFPDWHDLGEFGRLCDECEPALTEWLAAGK